MESGFVSAAISGEIQHKGMNEIKSYVPLLHPGRMGQRGIIFFTGLTDRRLLPMDFPTG